MGVSSDAPNSDMQNYSLRASEDDDVQVAVVYASQPFLVQVGDPQTGVSIAASHLNQSGTHTYGETLPADVVWCVLQAETE